jgi:cytochrome c peroxidase
MRKLGYTVTGLVLVLEFFLSGLQSSALGQDPVALTDMEQLGKAIFFDPGLSVTGLQSCASCHDPFTGFTGPDSDENDTLAVYEGAIPRRYGNRKPPTSAYCGESPLLYYDEDLMTWFGGMFWDGRATGWSLGDPLSEQAKGPFLNPLEQAMPNARLVCIQIATSDYAGLFETVWGPGSLDYAKDAEGAYERIVRSVAAYERSAEVNPFSSKFDLFWANAKADGKDPSQIRAYGIPAGMGGGMGGGGMGGGGMGGGLNTADNPARWEYYRNLGLSDDELKGLAVFNDPNRGNCASCHTLTESAEGGPPLFTDFGYYNLGLPKNPDNPYYDMPKKWNPDGQNWVDPGLGGFLKAAEAQDEIYAVEMGKFKTPTLRNVNLRPYPEFVKAYGHNGFFKSLDGMEGIVHFYAWRAMMDAGMVSGPMMNLFPEPELDENRITMQPFMFPTDGLKIITFLKTLSDGYSQEDE